MTLTDTEVSGDRASGLYYADGGGVLDASGGRLTVTGGTFSGDVALASYVAAGGGIADDGTATLTADGVSFFNNLAMTRSTPAGSNPEPRAGRSKPAGIPFETPDGVVDLHSLRHGYITTLARCGVPVKTLRTLARHADPRLTMNGFAHASLFDTSGVAEASPDLSHNPQTSRAKAATGTDGLIAHRHPSDSTGPARPEPWNSGVEGSPRSKLFALH
jgi:hypothetical protein